MTYLSDTTLRSMVDLGWPVDIHPFNLAQLQPASYDVLLGDRFIVMDNPDDFVVDAVTKESNYRDVYADTYILQPRSMVLGTTVERVTLGATVCAEFEGKSSLERLGLLTDASGGFVDPGFVGQVSVNIINCSPSPVRLHAGMKIGQLVFKSMDRAVDRYYGHPDLGSHYQNQAGPGVARS